MYEEYLSKNGVILAHIDHIYMDGGIRTVAMVEDGKLIKGADYMHAQDCDAVKAFAEYHGVHDDGNRKKVA